MLSLFFWEVDWSNKHRSQKTKPEPLLSSQKPKDYTILGVNSTLEKRICARRRFVGRERVSPPPKFFSTPSIISFHCSVYAIRLKTSYDSKRKRLRWGRIPVVYPKLSPTSKLAQKLAKAGVPWPTGSRRPEVTCAYRNADGDHHWHIVMNEKFVIPRDIISQLIYVSPTLSSQILSAIPKPASESLRYSTPPLINSTYPRP